MRGQQLIPCLCLVLATGCTIRDDPTKKASSVEKRTFGKSSAQPRMEFEVKERLRGLGPVSTNQRQPLLMVFLTQAAWEKYRRSQIKENADLVKVQLDWRASVLLMIRMQPNSGPEATPYVKGLVRHGRKVLLEVDWQINKGVPMLDVEVQPWLIVEAPAKAFSGAPELRFTVSGSTQGRVELNK